MTIDDDELYARQYRSFMRSGAKVASLFGVLALGTACFYDFVFWVFIDSRILTYYVIADHLQSAVAAIAIVVVLAGLYVGVELLRFSLELWLMKRFAWRRSWVAMLVYVGSTALICALSYAIYGSLPWRDVTQYASFVVFFAYATAFIPPKAQRLEDFAKTQLSLPVFAVSVFLSTVVLALYRGEDMLKAPGVDLVTYSGDDEKKGVSIDGLVVRMLDRGLLIRLNGGRRIAFIPKERLIRVDQNAARIS